MSKCEIVYGTICPGDVLTLTELEKHFLSYQLYKYCEGENLAYLVLDKVIVVCELKGNLIVVGGVRKKTNDRLERIFESCRLVKATSRIKNDERCALTQPYP